MFYYFIALIFATIDQITKWMVATSIEIGQTIPIVEDVFHFTSFRNRGAAFGILQNQSWLFVSVTLIITVVIVYMLYRGQPKPLSVGLSLVLGGALGNLIDRVFKNGEIVDWLDFRLIHFPIFNLADTFLVIGVGLIMFDTFSTEKETKPNVK